jgi:hypothetical protein
MRNEDIQMGLSVSELIYRRIGEVLIEVWLISFEGLKGKNVQDVYSH